MNSLLDPRSTSLAPAVASASPRPVPLSTTEQPGLETQSPSASWFVWACPCCRATLQTVATAQRGHCPACGSMVEAPPPPTTAPETPVAAPAIRRLVGWLRRRGWQLLAVFVAGLAFASGMVLLARAQPWARLLVGFGLVPSDQPPTSEALRVKLDRFLKAPDWTGKRAHVLDSDRLDAAGSTYYRGRDPDEIKAVDFHLWTMPGLDRLAGVAVLRADRPGRRPVLAIFRKVDRDWHLDWEMFSQTYDEALPAFLATPSFPLRTFRTRIGRDFAAAAADDAYAIQLSDVLDAGQRISVQLPTGTPIMRAVAGGLSGTATREATVEVSWARSGSDGHWVPVLNRLVCWGWHGLNGLPERADPADPSNENFSVPTSAPQSAPAPASESPAEATVASTSR